MQTNRLYSAVTLISLILLCRCATTPEGVTEREPSDNSPDYRFAHNFNSLVTETLSPTETESFWQSCQATPRMNPFCAILPHRKELSARLSRLHAEPQFVPATPVEAVAPQFKAGKISNWRALRRAKVRPLIKGLEGVEPATLDRLVQLAQGEKQCPNTVAAALAATLENQLPAPRLSEKIARLYEKGATCMPRRDEDRDPLLIRAGLFAYHNKDYRSAARLLGKVKSEDAYQARHLYWLARAQARLGQGTAAAATIQRLAHRHPFSFHATLLNLGSSRVAGPSQVSAERPVASSRRYPKIEAWLNGLNLLSKYGFREGQEFLAEWILDKHPRVETPIRQAVLAKASAQTKVEWTGNLLLRERAPYSLELLQLNYPLYEKSTVESQANGVDPLLLLALARKESHFNPKAISPANARGLLQLLPETAKRVTGGDPNLFDVKENVRAGARYISSLLKRFSGKETLAIAAYNAGEEAVDKWLARYDQQDPMLFLDMIPFRETRDYVGYVMTNYYWYQKLYAAQSSLTAFQDLVTTEVALK